MWVQYRGYRIKGTELRVQNLWHRILGTEYWVQSCRYRVVGTELGTHGHFLGTISDLFGWLLEMYVKTTKQSGKGWGFPGRGFKGDFVGMQTYKLYLQIALTNHTYKLYPWIVPTDHNYKMYQSYPQIVLTKRTNKVFLKYWSNGLYLLNDLEFDKKDLKFDTLYRTPLGHFPKVWDGCLLLLVCFLIL